MIPTDPRTDLELITAINRGELGAFDALYHRHRDWVYRLAYRFTHHHDDALDVLQETFAYVARKFPGFTLTAGMTSFLYPVVKNTSITLLKRKRREVAFDPAAIPETAEAAIGPADDLFAVLAGLSDDHREILLLRFVDGFTLDEIATALQIPIGTAKSRLHHAIAQLREDPRARKYFENL